jgi:glycyl-tRNA synthetase
VTLAFLVDAYTEETLEDGTDRVVLKLHPALAPFKAAVLPLTKKLNDQAEELYHELQKHFNVDYDDAGSIGKRYRRHDEVGTPYCITFDFDSIDDKAVTIRDRDTMVQERVKIDELVNFINNKIKF